MNRNIIKASCVGLLFAAVGFGQDLIALDTNYGSLIHGQITSANPVLGRTQTPEVLLHVFDQMASTPTASASPIPPSLTFLDINSINAFSSLGGHIYVTSSLVRAIDGNAGILAFVLGHELAHNLYQHPLRKYLREITKEREIAIYKYRAAHGDNRANWELLAYVATEKIASAKIERDEENAADKLGLMIAAEAGYHPAFGILAARTLRERVGEMSKFAAFFADHPRWTTREERAEQNYSEAVARFNTQWTSTELSPGGRPPVLLSISEPQISKSHAGREIAATYSARNLNGVSTVVKLLAIGSGGSRSAATRVLVSDEQGAVTATLTDQDMKALGDKVSVSVTVESDGVTSYVGPAKHLK